MSIKELVLVEFDDAFLQKPKILSINAGPLLPTEKKEKYKHWWQGFLDLLSQYATISMKSAINIFHDLDIKYSPSKMFCFLFPPSFPSHSPLRPSRRPIISLPICFDLSVILSVNCTLHPFFHVNSGATMILFLSITLIFHRSFFSIKS